MRVSVNTTSFEKQMNNIIKYSSGFLEGAQKGKTLFLQNAREVLGGFHFLKA